MKTAALFALSFLVILASPSQEAIAQTDLVVMNVYTDKVTYTPDDSLVKVNGCVHSATSLLDGKQVTIQILDPSNNLIASDEAVIDDTCNFTYTLDMNESETEFGNYLVQVSYGNQTGGTAFRFSNESNTKHEGECSIDYCTFYFELYAKIYPIQYQATSGRVVAMSVDLPAHALMVNTNSTNNGLLTIVLPREIIDSKQDDGTDKEYFVSMADIAGGSDSGEAEFHEPRLTFDNPGSRLLQIDYPAGYMQIQIAGTHFVPEFGVHMVPIAMMIAGASALIAARKAGLKT